jgi:hypothetical protein
VRAYDYRCTLPCLARNSGVVCHDGLGDSQSQSGCIPVSERGLEAREHPTQLPNNASAWSSFQRTNANPFPTYILLERLHRFPYMFRLNPCLQCVARRCLSPMFSSSDSAADNVSQSHVPDTRQRILTGQGRGCRAVRCSRPGWRSHRKPTTAIAVPIISRIAHDRSRRLANEIPRYHKRC